MAGHVADKAAAVFGVLLIAAGPTSLARGQTAIGLRELTATAERLPLGCGLTPSPSVRTADGRTRGGLWAGLPSNPWVGTDRAILSSIYERVIDPVPTPDGPPFSKTELARFRLRLADEVEEGYAAIYTDGGPSLITVHAVRYEAGAKPMPPRSRSLRFPADRIVVTVSGLESPCLRAVRTHLEKLGAQ